MNWNPEEAIKRLRRRTTYSNGCWLWTGSINKSGHGMVYISGLGRIYVHRLIAVLCLNLHPFDSSVIVCHKVTCPNPNCWNPLHIYKGDKGTNTRDAIASGRGWVGWKAQRRAKVTVNELDRPSPKRN